jgi:FeS assembly protein IscX
MVSDYWPSLYWDSAFAIAVALLSVYPNTDPEFVGLEELATMVVQLPGFADDPELANDRLLKDIIITWYEERETV